MQSGESGGKLAELIKKAIRDCEVSNTEYNEILSLAGEDSHIDAQEQSLLSQLVGTLQLQSGTGQSICR